GGAPTGPGPPTPAATAAGRNREEIKGGSGGKRPFPPSPRAGRPGPSQGWPACRSAATTALIERDGRWEADGRPRRRLAMWVRVSVFRGQDGPRTGQGGPETPAGSSSRRA